MAKIVRNVCVMLREGHFWVRGFSNALDRLLASICLPSRSKKRWISVLTNSKQEALNVALDERRPSGENSVEDLTRAISADIRRMPGNSVCCDCGAPGDAPSPAAGSVTVSRVTRYSPVPSSLQPDRYALTVFNHSLLFSTVYKVISQPM